MESNDKPICRQMYTLDVEEQSDVLHLIVFYCWYSWVLSCPDLCFFCAVVLFQSFYLFFFWFKTFARCVVLNRWALHSSILSLVYFMLTLGGNIQNIDNTFHLSNLVIYPSNWHFNKAIQNLTSFAKYFVVVSNIGYYRSSELRGWLPDGNMSCFCPDKFCPRKKIGQQRCEQLVERFVT